MTADSLAQNRILTPAKVTASFSMVNPGVRDTILSMPPTAANLEAAWSMVPALGEVELRQGSALHDGDGSLRIASWNIQQCHFVEETAAVLARERIDLALFTELDVGLTRTGQRHTAREMTACLERLGLPGYGYGLGVEFYELLATPGLRASPDGLPDNSVGYHANGWLTRTSAGQPVLIRLPAEADWFVKPRRNQRRVGGRVAVAARVPLAGRELVVATVHLESDTGPKGRQRQMEYLLRALDAYAGDDAVIIGGDFNAGARVDGFDHSREGLFDAARNFGYEWESCNTAGPTSRPSLVTNAVQQNQARYDWFFIRGCVASRPAVIPALDLENQPISDHDAIAVTISLR